MVLNARPAVWQLDAFGDWRQVGRVAPGVWDWGSDWCIVGAVVGAVAFPIFISCIECFLRVVRLKPAIEANFVWRRSCDRRPYSRPLTTLK